MGAIADGQSAAERVNAGKPVLVHSFDSWRACARDLLAHGLAPGQVHWVGHAADAELSAGLPAGSPALRPAGSVLRISRHFLELLQCAACYRSAHRWAFLYLVLWRWQHGDKQVLSTGDVHGARLHAMLAAVRRAEHEMLHCIRFHERLRDAGPPRFVAWFEPRHDVLARVAQHFAKRMARVTWMMASPEASMLWDGASLHSTGALIHDGIGDSAALAQSLGRYREMFNPARLGAELRKR